MWRALAPPLHEPFSHTPQTRKHPMLALSHLVMKSPGCPAFLNGNWLAYARNDFRQFRFHATAAAFTSADIVKVGSVVCKTSFGLIRRW